MTLALWVIVVVLVAFGIDQSISRHNTNELLHTIAVTLIERLK